MALLLFVTQSMVPVVAASGDRTLYLHHTHTGETGTFTFKRNGVYDKAVLQQLNIFLADWRTKEPTKMDPALFDLIWQIYQEVHATQPVNIVSSYRSPKTNAMLRAKSSGVAENSQHIQGKAMDIFIPGIDLSTLRATAMRHQVGGVGFYPTSGSPFVHVDTGSVRAWPRMTTAQLKKVFPDGRTLHIPVDGKPLSDKGRSYAQTEWNKCHMVPCSGVQVPQQVEILTASLDPAQRSVDTINVNALFPAPRPGFMEAALSAPSELSTTSIFPATKSPEMRLATRGPLPVESNALAAFDLLQDPNEPQPRVLMSPETTDLLTAYAPEIAPDEGAQRALQMLIARETTASLNELAVEPPPIPDLPAPPAATGPAQTTSPGATQLASLDPSDIRPGVAGGTNGLDVVSTMFDLTWTAVTEAGARPNMQSALNGRGAIPKIDGLEQRPSDFVAPEIDHIDETLGTPELLSAMHYAEMYEPEGYLDNRAELGPYASRLVIESNLVAPDPFDHFIRRAPQIIASN